MSTLTSKELTALEDTINAEQVLVKKYKAMAMLAQDQAIKDELNGYATKHQQHASTLLTFLQ
ncbi:MAG: spore coat protein [Oscillospiraceae bacterium]|jgi:acid stress-induced BolA-like protein IbaG/YrbA|nr:spore coat protein [Oscillospiraceae bacterium]